MRQKVDRANVWSTFLSVPKHMAVAPIVLGLGLLIPPVAGAINLARTDELAQKTLPLSEAERRLASKNTTFNLFERYSDKGPPPSLQESLEVLAPTLTLFKKAHPELHEVFMEAVRGGRIEISNSSQEGRSSFAEYYPANDSFFIHSQTFQLSDGLKVLVLAHEASHRSGRSLEALSSLTLDRSASVLADLQIRNHLGHLKEMQDLNESKILVAITQNPLGFSAFSGHKDPLTNYFMSQNESLDIQMNAATKEREGWIKDGLSTFSNAEIAARKIEKGLSESLFGVAMTTSDWVGEAIEDRRPWWLQKLSAAQSIVGAFLIALGIRTKVKAMAKSKEALAREQNFSG